MNAIIKGLDVELAGNTYVLVNTDMILPPNSDITRDSLVKLPVLPGNYPLIVTLSYYNGKQIVTLRHVGQFYYRKQALLPESCRLDEVTIARTGVIVISCPRPKIWRLVLPNEIKIISEKIQGDRKVISYFVPGRKSGTWQVIRITLNTGRRSDGASFLG